MVLTICPPLCIAQAERPAPIKMEASTELRPIIKSSISLTDAIDTAITNYPTLKRSQATLAKSRSAVALAKTAYLPSFDLLAQELRTTTNNIAGSIFPQVLNVIPIQTGPANDSSSFKSVFANDFGFNFSWLVYDGGERHAGVQVARAKERSGVADVNLTRLDVGAGVAEAYLEAVSAQETIRAQKATVERMNVYNLIVHTLVDKGLRPGVDAARADADLSNAKIMLIDAERESELASIDLAEKMGLAGRDIDTQDAPWIRQPIESLTTRAAIIDQHPLAILKQREVEEAHAKVVFTEKSYRPRLWFHSGMWARGSGVRIDAHPVASGIVPQNANYIAGFGIDFPVLNYFSVKAQTGIAQQAAAADQANYDLAIQTLTQKDARAKVLLRNARKIADQTPLLVTAARENEMKALERYRVGLANILEVAEAQRILQNAEVQNAVAQVRIWRAFLASAYAQGDLSPFVRIAKQAEAGLK